MSAKPAPPWTDEQVAAFAKLVKFVLQTGAQPRKETPVKRPA